MLSAGAAEGAPPYLLPRGARNAPPSRSGSALPEMRADDPRDCGSSNEVMPRTDRALRRRSGPDVLARRDRNPAHSAVRLHSWVLSAVRSFEWAGAVSR